jgi:hypothetical protein
MVLSFILSPLLDVIVVVKCYREGRAVRAALCRQPYLRPAGAVQTIGFVKYCPVQAG